jgi:Sensors of blue-light using FAD
LSSLIQLVYASRSTFVATSGNKFINPHIAEIIAEARSYNSKNGIHGVLYFGDNYYLQCLEGEESSVLTLYSKIMKDPRHKDVVTISKQPIESMFFSQWGMKHVPLEPQLKELLISDGHDKFDPHHINDELVQRILVLLYNVSETELPSGDAVKH